MDSIQLNNRKKSYNEFLSVHDIESHRSFNSEINLEDIKAQIEDLKSNTDTIEQRFDFDTIMLQKEEQQSSLWVK